MNANLKSCLLTTTLVTAILLTAGAKAAHKTMVNSGMMESGQWYDFGGIWLTVSAIAAIGVGLFVTLRQR